MGLGELLRPGDTVLVGTGTGEPVDLIEALIAASPSVYGLRAIQVMTGGREKLADAAGRSLSLVSPVPGQKTRKAINEGRAELLTLPMSGLLDAILNGSLRIDGVLMQGRAIDAYRATPGLIADIMVPAWERARFRALELNASLPRIGCASELEIAHADLVVHSDRPPNELPEDEASAAALSIGNLVATIVADGATIELGVGRALAGITSALIEQRRNLAMHTGIVGDAAMRLIEAGCVTRPLIGKACAIGATAMGTQAFYAWADGNERIALTDSRRAHNSDYLASWPSFTAINSAIQVDLQGNANATMHSGRLVSGPGGAVDFSSAGVRGAASIIAIFSTNRDGASNIVATTQAVSLPGNFITHVVTEHGVANLRELSPHKRSRELIAIAAPQHRQDLARAAGIFL